MDLLDLTGKTVLITGASGGLGENFARCLARAGARVIITASRFDKLKDIEKSIGNAFAIEMDVSDKSSVSRAFNYLEKKHERIDICINNAGIGKETPIFEDDPDNLFEQIIQTNLMGTWYVTKAAANHIKNRNIHGSIINIGSVNGNEFPCKGGASYNASKAAVMHMTKGLVGELSPYRIRINTISPGFFPTDMTRFANEAFVETVKKMIPLGFIPDLNDINGLILYLALNNASRYVSGSCFTIDGGLCWGGWNGEF